jgi:hypothetical protein
MALRRNGSNSPRRGGGVPAWLVFIIAVALVMGGFYLWQGLQRFVRTGGLGIPESTQRAQIESTATAERVVSASITRTPMASATPLPECQDFRVEITDAPNAIVRESPSRAGEVVDAYDQGTLVCVLWLEAGSEYYAIDSNPATQRFELAYMHQSVLEPLNPTPTPSATMTAPPTVTLMPTGSPTPTALANVPPTATSDSAQPTMPGSGSPETVPAPGP